MVTGLAIKAARVRSFGVFMLFPQLDYVGFEIRICLSHSLMKLIEVI
jgi:hypothetical protein